MSAGLPVIGLHGAPRSGTTWIGQILNSAPQVAFRFQPFFAYAFRARIDACKSPEELANILGEIERTEDDFILQRGEARIAKRELSFEKSLPAAMAYKEVRYHHLLPMLMEIGRFTGVGVVRDPVNVLTSWVNAPREFDPAWDLAAEWRHAPSKNAGRPEEFYGYEGWKRATLLFEDLASRYPQRFRILSYERLVADPAAEVSDLFGFLGISVAPQVESFLARSTDSDDGDPYGVFRAPGHHRPQRRLPSEIEQEIVEDLRRSGLQRYAAARLNAR